MDWAQLVQDFLLWAEFQLVEMLAETRLALRLILQLVVAVEIALLAETQAQLFQELVALALQALLLVRPWNTVEAGLEELEAQVTLLAQHLAVVVLAQAKQQETQVQMEKAAAAVVAEIMLEPKGLVAQVVQA